MFTAETNQRKETSSIKKQDSRTLERVDVEPQQSTQLNSSSQQRHIVEKQGIVNWQEKKIKQYTSSSKGMSTDNSTGIQTRSMTEAQCIEGEANRELANNQEQAQGAPNSAMNPTMDLHKAKEEAIKEFIRWQGTIALDWYVPNFSNTRVEDLITERLPIETTGGKILFNCLSSQWVLPHIHFWVGSNNRKSVHLP